MKTRKGNKRKSVREKISRSKRVRRTKRTKRVKRTTKKSRNVYRKTKRKSNRKSKNKMKGGATDEEAEEAMQWVQHAPMRNIYSLSTSAEALAEKKNWEDTALLKTSDPEFDQKADEAMKWISETKSNPVKVKTKEEKDN